MTPDLRCTVCGSTISVQLAYVGHGHMERRELDSYECDDYSCAATWDKDGKTFTPSWKADR